MFDQVLQAKELALHRIQVQTDLFYAQIQKARDIVLGPLDHEMGMARLGEILAQSREHIQIQGQAGHIMPVHDVPMIGIGKVIEHLDILSEAHIVDAHQ